MYKILIRSTKGAFSKTVGTTDSVVDARRIAIWELLKMNTMGRYAEIIYGPYPNSELAISCVNKRSLKECRPSSKDSVFKQYNHNKNEYNVVSRNGSLGKKL